MNNNLVEIELVITPTTDVMDSLKRLTPKLGKNYKLLSDKDVEEIFSSKNTFVFVARDTEKSRIVGMLTLLVFRIPYVRKGIIEDVVVDEEYRGQGIGEQLMEKALFMAGEKGVSYVDLTSSPTRTASNSLYKKLGFELRETNVYRKVIDYGEI